MTKKGNVMVTHKARLYSFRQTKYIKIIVIITVLLHCVGSSDRYIRVFSEIYFGTHLLRSWLIICIILVECLLGQLQIYS